MDTAPFPGSSEIDIASSPDLVPYLPSETGYCSMPIMEYLTREIETPDQNNRHYEHVVSSWASTMLRKVFHDTDTWIITPEKRKPQSNKKPDFFVEKFDNASGEAYVWMFMEVKSSTGDRFEKALQQVADDLLAHFDEDTDTSRDTYLVVQKGTKIGFFEYHNYLEGADSRVGLPKKYSQRAFRCTSLTQDLWHEKERQKIMPYLPEDLELLYHNTRYLQNIRDIVDDKTREVRVEAKEYKIPCVFDLNKHKREIDYLFDYISKHSPREAPDLHDLPDETIARFVKEDPERAYLS